MVKNILMSDEGIGRSQPVIKTKVKGAILPAAYGAEFQGTRFDRSWGQPGREIWRKRVGE